MTEDNIIPFTKKATNKTDTYKADDIRFTFDSISFDDVNLHIPETLLHDIINSFPNIDDELLQDQLADELFTLQLLIDSHPELAQFTIAHIKKFTQNLVKNIKK